MKTSTLGVFISFGFAFTLSCVQRNSNEQTKINESKSTIESTPMDISPFPKDYQAWEGCKKQEYLMQRIRSSKYDSLPPVIAANPLLPTFNMSLTMDHNDDTLPESRPKAIHRSGSTAAVEFVASPDTPFTGLWQGARCAIVRLSLATKLEGSTVPGAAFKFLVDRRQSENFVAMFSLDGQKNDYNFFSNSFSNVVAPPKNPILKLLAKAFERASPFPTAVYLSGISQVTDTGNEVAQAKWPLRIFLDPNPKFAEFSKDEHDFRTDVATVQSGTLLYTVYAVVPSSSGDASAEASWQEIQNPDYREKAIKIGEFKTTSEFVASRWADERLFFRHQRYAEKKP